MCVDSSEEPQGDERKAALQPLEQEEKTVLTAGGL